MIKTGTEYSGKKVNGLGLKCFAEEEIFLLATAPISSDRNVMEATSCDLIM